MLWWWDDVWWWSTDAWRWRGRENKQSRSIATLNFVPQAKEEEPDEGDADEGDQNEYQRGETWNFIYFFPSPKSHTLMKAEVHFLQQASQPSYTKFRRPMLINQWTTTERWIESWSNYTSFRWFSSRGKSFFRWGNQIAVASGESKLAANQRGCCLAMPIDIVVWWIGCETRTTSDDVWNSVLTKVISRIFEMKGFTTNLPLKWDLSLILIVNSA